jgi:hypothetical protein
MFMLVVSGSRIKSTSGWLEAGATLDVDRQSICQLILQKRVHLIPPA